MGMACEVLGVFSSSLEALICGEMVFETPTLSRIGTTSRSDVSCGLENAGRSGQKPRFLKSVSKFMPLVKFCISFNWHFRFTD